VILMRWHKDGERENKEVMVHPSDSDTWKTLDNFESASRPPCGFCRIDDQQLDI
jgi:hypothetical protein